MSRYAAIWNSDSHVIFRSTGKGKVDGKCGKRIITEPQPKNTRVNEVSTEAGDIIAYVKATPSR